MICKNSDIDTGNERFRNLILKLPFNAILTFSPGLAVLIL
jgi:hypothetical protein